MTPNQKRHELIKRLEVAIECMLIEHADLQQLERLDEWNEQEQEDFDLVSRSWEDRKKALLDHLTRE